MAGMVGWSSQSRLVGGEVRLSPIEDRWQPCQDVWVRDAESRTIARSNSTSLEHRLGSLRVAKRIAFSHMGRIS